MAFRTIRTENPVALRLAQRTMVWVNDVDVASRCFAADDEEGWADLYLLDANGQTYVLLGRCCPDGIKTISHDERSCGYVAFEHVTGRVRFTER
mgnify:CR=1 FL=1